MSGDMEILRRLSLMVSLLLIPLWYSIQEILYAVADMVLFLVLAIGEVASVIALMELKSDASLQAPVKTEKYRALNRKLVNKRSIGKKLRVDLGW